MIKQMHFNFKIYTSLISEIPEEYVINNLQNKILEIVNL